MVCVEKQSAVRLKGCRGGDGEGAELELSANTIQQAVEKALKGSEEVG